jgi:hypothetical protein
VSRVENRNGDMLQADGSTSFVVLEAHADSATLYLRGPVTVAALERAWCVAPSAPVTISLHARGLRETRSAELPGASTDAPLLYG